MILLSLSKRRLSIFIWSKDNKKGLETTPNLLLWGWEVLESSSDVPGTVTHNGKSRL